MVGAYVIPVVKDFEIIPSLASHIHEPMWHDQYFKVGQGPSLWKCMANLDVRLPITLEHVCESFQATGWFW